MKETMLSRDGTDSSFVAKVRGEVFAHFHVVAVKVTVVCEIDCLIRHFNVPLGLRLPHIEDH
jgi:hypothetical protein